MKNDISGLPKRFFPAPYVAGGSFSRSSAKPKTTESKLDGP